MSQTPEQKFRELYEEMFDLCEEHGWGDPFSYARSKEIHMAGLLGHTVSDTLSGADGYDEDGGCEYKSTIGNSIAAHYGAISCQPTWDEQVRYLREDKIAKYKNHYYARYEGGKVVELWKLDGNDVLEIILPKVRRAFQRKQDGKQNKDPRFSASVCKSEIYAYGERLI